MHQLSDAVMVAGGLMLYLLLFWYAYILVMGLYRAHLLGRLTGLAKWCAVPAVLIGWLMDWAANWLIATLLFREPPHAWNELVTNRLMRYVSGPEGTNKTYALWVCEHLLDYFDPTGAHCK